MLNRSSRTALTAAGLSLAALLTTLTTTTAWARLNTGPVLSVAALDDDDPVTGEWEGTISADQMPDEEDVLITLELGEDGETVTGTFAAPDQSDDTAAFEGTFDAESGTIEGDLTDPDAEQSFPVELTIDGDDMTGTITIDAGDFQLVLDVTATRKDDDDDLGR